MSRFDDLEAAAEAGNRRCPRCRAQPGAGCRSTITGELLPAPHWQRYGGELPEQGELEVESTTQV